MAALVIDIPSTEMDQIREKAQKLGIDVESFVHFGIFDILQTPDDEAKELAERLFVKNHDVLKRLA